MVTFSAPLMPDAELPVSKPALPLSPSPMTSLERSRRRPDPKPLPEDTLTSPPAEGALDAPAAIATEPPRPTPEEPTRRDMSPALPPEEVPVDSSKGPEALEEGPLPTDTPPLAAPAPLPTATGPLLPARVAPESTATAPEPPAAEKPEITDKLPLVPAELGPVDKRSSPLRPDDVEPVETVAMPLEPRPVALLELSCREPEPVAAPMPDETITSPPTPAEAVEEPAEICTEPPLS